MDCPKERKSADIQVSPLYGSSARQPGSHIHQPQHCQRLLATLLLDAHKLVTRGGRKNIVQARYDFGLESFSGSALIQLWIQLLGVLWRDSFLTPSIESEKDQCISRYPMNIKMPYQAKRLILLAGNWHYMTPQATRQTQQCTNRINGMRGTKENRFEKNWTITSERRAKNRQNLLVSFDWPAFGGSPRDPLHGEVDRKVRWKEMAKS